MTTNVDKYKLLITQRSAILTSVQHNLSAIQLEVSKTTPRDIEHVREEYDVMEDKWLRIEGLVKEIRNYNAIHPLDNETEVEYEKVREDYLKARRRATTLFEQMDKAAAKVTQDAVDQALYDQRKDHEAALKDAMETRQRSKTHTRLPDQKLRVYKGDVEDYFPWKLEFDAAVHSNPEIPIINKFNYLKQATADGGIVEQTIKGLHCSEESYKEALKLLKNRFERS